MYGSTQRRQAASKLVKQVTGTTETIQQMILSDVYCPKILQQIDSAIGMLQKSRITLLEDHLTHCLEHRMNEDKQSTINELIDIFRSIK